MIQFIAHITTEIETARLPGIQQALKHHFPESRLQVLNQTMTPIEDSMMVENTKQCGFGWTLRFLQTGLEQMQEDDLLIKIDPDIDIKGNPLEGISIPSRACFGQIKMVKDCPVFLGGFQGFTFTAAQDLLVAGKKVENNEGPQDVILYCLGASSLGMSFISLPWVDLWASRENYDPNCKIISWSRHVRR